MSSDRLYYTDSYLVEFDAVVRDVTPRADRWLVSLDRSAFYPTSGGQPFDMGTIGDANVVDVFDQEDGTVGHVVDRPLEKNSRVRGHIDWNRRFDHMQQHTGQHVLSAALEKEVGAKTVSFHLGTKTSTIDLDKELSPQQLAQAEDAANKVERLVEKAAAALVLAPRIGERFQGIVTGASSKGVWARIFDPPVEGRVEENEKGLDVGDRVTVRLTGVNPDRGFIDFARV